MTALAHFMTLGGFSCGTSCHLHGTALTLSWHFHEDSMTLSWALMAPHDTFIKCTAIHGLRFHERL